MQNSIPNSVKIGLLAIPITVASPYWGGIYVKSLGKTLNICVNSENGKLYNKEGKEPKEIKPKTEFEHNLSRVGTISEFLLLGGFPVYPYLFTTTASYLKQVYGQEPSHKRIKK